MPVSAEDKIKAVKTYVDSYCAGDLDGIVSIFADDATVEDPVGTPPICGIDAIREFMAAGVGMGAKLKLEGNVRCAKDYAAFPFIVTLTYEGNLTAIEVIDIFKFNDDGKVSEMRAFFGSENMGAASGE